MGRWQAHLNLIFGGPSVQCRSGGGQQCDWQQEPPKRPPPIATLFIPSRAASGTLKNRHNFLIAMRNPPSYADKPAARGRGLVR